MSTLNEEQKLALQLVEAGYNCFVTGPAGTGKSHFIGELDKRKTLKVTASTGVAAQLVGGETPFSAFRMPWDINKPCKVQPNLFKGFDVLVIDEVSMLSAEVFEYLEAHARRSLGVDRFFGGIQVVLVGDFYQLPPVQGKLIFTSSLWRHFKTIILHEVYRQQGRLQQVLRRIRVGEPTQADLSYLQGLSRPIPSGPIKPTLLSSYRKMVETSNRRELKKLSHIYTFEGYVTTGQAGVWKKTTIPRILELAEGAQVMHLVNHDGLCNGSRGVVVGFTSDFGLPVVQFKDRKVTIRPYAVPVKDGKKRYEIIQIPLCLAWALTIHKVQGQSLDCVEIDLRGKRGCFAAGQFYVALSRATNEDGVCLRGFKPSHIIVDEKIAAFYLTAQRQQDNLRRLVPEDEEPDEEPEDEEPEKPVKKRPRESCDQGSSKKPRKDIYG